MISSHQEYKEYIEADRIALFMDKNRPGILDDIWKWEILLRKTEYYRNCKFKWYIGKIIYGILRWRFHRESVRLGFSIPLNTCGKGLSLAHYGSVAINPKSKIGERCRIYSDVVVGAKNPGGGAPTIGNDVMIGAGAKVLGEICIADGVIIGANSLVIHSVETIGTVVAGNPAKVIRVEMEK